MTRAEDILKWARSTAAYSVEEAAHKLLAKPEKGTAWEEGAESPSMSQLRKMAHGRGPRHLLGVTLEVQRTWRSARVSYKAWCAAIERIGDAAPRNQLANSVAPQAVSASPTTRPILKTSRKDRAAV